MKIFKPSIAKIISTPGISIVILLAIQEIYVKNFGYGNFEVVSLMWLIISLLVAYFISCIIWFRWGNHRRILIVIFTLLSIVGINILSGFIEISFCHRGVPPCFGDGSCTTPN